MRNEERLASRDAWRLYKKDHPVSAVLYWLGFILMLPGSIFSIATDRKALFFVSFLGGLVLIVAGAIVRQKLRLGFAEKRNGKMREQLIEAMQRARTGAASQTPRQTQSRGGVYRFTVAGLFYRMDAVYAIAERNGAYWLADADLCCSDEAMPGRRIYEYRQELPDPVLMREPDNPHDPNAIAVYIKAWHVGYVPADLTAEVGGIMRGKYTATARLSGGRWKAVDDDDSVERGETRISIEIALNY